MLALDASTRTAPAPVCSHPPAYCRTTALVDLPSLRPLGVAVSCSRCALLVHVERAA